MATQQLNYFLAIIAFAFSLSVLSNRDVSPMDSTHITLGKDGDRCNVRIHAPEGRGEVTLDIKAPCEVPRDQTGKPYGVLIAETSKTFLLCGAVKTCTEDKRGCGTGSQALVIKGKAVFATDFTKQKKRAKRACIPTKGEIPTYWIEATDTPLKKVGQLK